MGKISPKKRFDVLQRDGFTCKYCGAKAPNVQLEVDHIVPKSKGGTANMNNLITSCFNCNRGKSNSGLKEGDGKLHKRKINQIVSDCKKYFYKKRNMLHLGTIDQKTMSLLSIYITDQIKGSSLIQDNIEIYCIGKKNLEEGEKEFLIGGEFCDKICELTMSVLKINWDDAIENIVSSKDWRDDAPYNERLNFYLTERRQGEAYIIGRFTLFPNYIGKWKQSEQIR